MHVTQRDTQHHTWNAFGYHLNCHGVRARHTRHQIVMPGHVKPVSQSFERLIQCRMNIRPPTDGGTFAKGEGVVTRRTARSACKGNVNSHRQVWPDFEWG